MDGYFAQDRRELLSFLPAKAARVLEVGCGEGRFAAHVREQCEAKYICGIEIDPIAAEAAKKRLHRVLLGGVEDGLLQIQGQQFDLMVLNDVLGHLVDPVRVLKRLREVLHPSGQILVSLPKVRYLPNLFELLIKKDWHYRDSGILDRTHLRFFTRKSALRFFAECGLQVIRVSGLDPLSWVKFLPFFMFSFGILADTRYLQFAFLLKAEER